MKIFDTILFSLSVFFFVVGVYETIVLNSIQDTYFFFAFSVGTFLWYKVRKDKWRQQEQQQQQKAKQSTRAKGKPRPKSKKR